MELAGSLAEQSKTFHLANQVAKTPDCLGGKEKEGAYSN